MTVNKFGNSLCVGVLVVVSRSFINNMVLYYFSILFLFLPFFSSGSLIKFNYRLITGRISFFVVVVVVVLFKSLFIEFTKPEQQQEKLVLNLLNSKGK